MKKLLKTIFFKKKKGNDKIETKAKEMFYDRLVNSDLVGFYCLDRDGNILDCNKSEEKILGIDESKEKSNETVDVTLESWEHAQELMEKNSEEIIEENLVCNNQNKSYLSIKTPIFDKTQKKVTGLLGISIDITERKKAEQLAVEHKILQEKLKVQEASNKYIGTLAHELRTPLSSFKVILNLIEMNDENNSENPDERRRNLKMFTVKGDQVEKAGLSFIEMILYKIRSLTNKLDREKFQFCLIRDEVTDVLDKYPFNAGERELVSFDQANSFIYKGDKVATSHILFNLIKNTLKIINEEDRGKITIRFDKSDEKYNKLIFEDDAKGVDPKFLPYMFDSFVYKDSTGKGTGLGLAYCKMVMEDYDGDIICESELGKYTRFTCLFPKVDMSEFDFA